MSSLNYHFLSGRTELGTGSIRLTAVTKALSLVRATKRIEDVVEEELLAELAGDVLWSGRFRTRQPAPCFIQRGQSVIGIGWAPFIQCLCRYYFFPP